MANKQFTAFTKKILDLKHIISPNKAAKNYEGFILDCDAILLNFGVENLKKAIKMLLFCVGTKRYDFERVLYFKIDINNVSIAILDYITNLIHFTGRKEQVKIALIPNEKCLSFTDQILQFQKYTHIMIMPPLENLKTSLEIGQKLGIHNYIVNDKMSLSDCKYLLDNGATIYYNTENILPFYMSKICSIKMGK